MSYHDDGAHPVSKRPAGLLEVHMMGERQDGNQGVAYQALTANGPAQVFAAVDPATLRVEEEQAHPAALKPGDEFFVKARYNPDYTETGLLYLSANYEGKTFFPHPATVHPASALDDLRAKLEAAEAEIGRLMARDSEECCEDFKRKLINERDAARRDLAEALKLLKTTTFVAENEDEAWALELRKKAILARHERQERRKGERRKKDTSITPYNMKRRRGSSDRRKQPATVDWQARCEAAEAECERLRTENDSLSVHNKTLMKDAVDRSMEICREENHNKVAQVLNILTGAYRYHAIPVLIAKALNCSITPLDEDAAIREALLDATTATRRAEEAEAKLAKAQAALFKLDGIYRTEHDDPGPRPEWLQSAMSIDTPPEQEKGEEWPIDQLSQEWGDAVQLRIEALEAALAKMKGGE